MRNTTVALAISIGLLLQTQLSFAQTPPAAPTASAPAALPQLPSSALPDAPYGSPPAPTVPAPPPPLPAPPPPVDDDAPDTLWAPGRLPTLGGFGGVDPQISRIHGSTAVSVCGEGGLIIDHAFTFGGGGCGLASNVNVLTTDDKPAERLNFGYGGLIARYHFFAKRLINVSTGFLIGGGEVSIGNRDPDASAKNFDSVFVLVPEIAMNVNLTRWLRVGASGQYRIVSGVNTTNVSNSDLSSFGGGFHLHAGWF